MVSGGGGGAADDSSDNKNAKNISLHNVQTTQPKNVTSSTSPCDSNEYNERRSSLPVIDTLIQINNDNNDQESLIPYSTHPQSQLPQIPLLTSTVILPPISPPTNDQC